MKKIRFHPDQEPVATPAGVVSLIVQASDEQVAEKGIASPEDNAEFQLATDALNLHRVLWRLREEMGDLDPIFVQLLKDKLCHKRGYDPEEFDAAMAATRDRARLPFGWTTMQLAVNRMRNRPICLLDPELEASRYVKGVLSLAVHLQDIQKDQPILLPVEQVREILSAKKIVISGTIKNLVDSGLLEMVKSSYHTGAAREFLFKGVLGRDYVFMESN